mmetsp:Transcript_3065/g.7673  ORF Transcript_3065/g.7673 Transcript_3065/m.7673 type:complete len:143 (-) Transcript_3065:115-543(-)|eukprot:CAMPEP_0180286186 /NCGR_PEP_ID=MMETSP0988-20121125/12431_1 /TAXON_ID=697907 /ORGANISM="non described non described, Strain CCMP2293" /LENGTH=142 /DNA_ID=CAMNT_0022259881 /DNA_START=21 /DNA_END=449 /DNA_ORIENTATION=-
MPVAKQKVDFLSKSSLPLQVLIFFNGCYVALWFLANIAIFIWKGVELPYPANRLGPEVFLIFAVVIVNVVRLFLGSKGNKTENRVLLIIFIVLSLFAALGNIFFIIFQTYVLRIEMVLNVISLVFIGLETLFAIFAMVRFVS